MVETKLDRGGPKVVLVVGATGMLGTKICKALLDRARKSGRWFAERATGRGSRQSVSLISQRAIWWTSHR
jgi:uncharacterized protein YbjT (DUF2867 family)